MPDTNVGEANAGNANAFDGARGLAMAAPIVGLPAILHAVGGLFFTAPIILASGFVVNQFLPKGMNVGDLIKKVNQEPV